MSIKNELQAERVLRGKAEARVRRLEVQTEVLKREVLEHLRGERNAMAAMHRWHEKYEALASQWRRSVFGPEREEGPPL